MDNDMSTAKVGDKVWSIMRGWGEVIACGALPYPYLAPYNSIVVKFDLSGMVDSYDDSGRFMNSVIPDLYWDELHFDAPPKPKKKPTVEKWVAGRVAEDKAGIIVRTVREDFQRLKMFDSEYAALLDVFGGFYVDTDRIAFTAKVEVVAPYP